jgi:predicted GNAT family acetyltransferase
MGQRVYELRSVRPVHGVAGRLRDATPGDRPLLVRWTAEFHAEALGESDHSRIEDSVDAAFVPSPEGRRLFLWEVDGAPVSMAGVAGRTPRGIRVGVVYTPPALRSRGYASACVAAVSQAQLDAGREACFLFTDLANPTSNAIYQAIGYEPVADSEVYAFSPTG